VSKNSRVGARNGILLGALTGALVGSQYNKMIGMTEQNDGSVKLNIPGSVMFSTGSATISPAFASTLDSVAGTIKEYCGLTATVTGHTDNTGTVEGNRRLSEDRARSVANYLVSRGVDPMRLQQAGRGQNEPIATNATGSNFTITANGVAKIVAITAMWTPTQSATAIAAALAGDASFPLTATSALGVVTASWRAGFLPSSVSILGADGCWECAFEPG